MSGRLLQFGLLSLVSSALAAPVASASGEYHHKHGKCSLKATSSLAEAQAVNTVVASAATTSWSTVWVAPTSSAAAVSAAGEEKQPAPVYSTPAAAAPVASTSAAAAYSAVASAAPASGSSSGAKGGIGYTSTSMVSPFVGQSNIGWCYNWNSSPGNIPSGIEYIPTLWGTQSTYTSSWVANANAAIAKGATSVVGFNEPDDAGQSNLDYNTAATAYKQYITDNFSGKATLVAPSVTNGGAPMGLTYLSNFLGACSDCGISVINLHWYDSSTNIDYFKSYISGAYAQFKMPIYLTEFGTTDGNDAAFLAQALPWLEEQAYVQKYAYFWASSGVLLEGSALSSVGVTYATA